MVCYKGILTFSFALEFVHYHAGQRDDDVFSPLAGECLVDFGRAGRQGGVRCAALRCSAAWRAALKRWHAR
jgi:hypothetical protein